VVSPVYANLAANAPSPAARTDESNCLSPSDVLQTEAILIKGIDFVNENMSILEYSTKDMSKSNLGQYIQMLMDQKGLRAIDVERNCDKRITNSYISRIIKGEVTNPTVGTIDALAQGLDADPYELFAIAYGKSRRDSAEVAAASPLVLIEALRILVMNPQLIDLLQIWVTLSSEQQATLLSSIKGVTEREMKKGKRQRKR
jgi:transcriptional regulator with XRE-family HTH domain